MKLAIRTFILLMIGYQLTFAQEKENNLGRENRYVPDHTKLHYAGGIGFMSAGVGYELFPDKSGEADLFLGYLPESIGGEHVITVAAKFHYLPWKKKLTNPEYQVEPLTLGVLVYQSYGDDLNQLANKDNYPDGYYWWSLRTRFGPFIGSRITKSLGEHTLFRSVTFYYEIGTNDLYLYSFLPNTDAVPFHQIWNTSFGLKFIW